MPQLDSFSFFSQVFWVLFFFTFFYFINLRQVLPSIATILKVRRRTLQKSQAAFENMQSGKTESVTESHVEFFSLAKHLAPSISTSNENSNKFLSASYVKESFNSEFKKTAPSVVALKAFSCFARKMNG